MDDDSMLMKKKEFLPPRWRVLPQLGFQIVFATRNVLISTWGNNFECRECRWRTFI